MTAEESLSDRKVAIDADEKQPKIFEGCKRANVTLVLNGQNPKTFDFLEAIFEDAFFKVISWRWISRRR